MLFNSIFGRNRKQKSRNKTRAANKLNFESLETRNLLASVSFNAGVVTVAGNNNANEGSFVQIDASTYRATLEGVDSRDYAVGTVNEVVFIGFGGNDTFTNYTSVDSQLLGHGGNDTLTGGSGSDRIVGGHGNDTILGNEGDDILHGIFGNDTIRGGEGNDRLFGSAGVNFLYGDNGNDVVFGGDDVDTIFGGDGYDQIFGLGGNDFLHAGDGGIPGTGNIDLVLGLGGDDTITGGSGLNVLYGSSGDDTITGGSGENRLHGQNGADVLTGGPLADYIAGQNGDDVISALGGNDFILPGFGDDIVDSGQGSDFVAVNFNFADYTLTSNGSGLNVSHVSDGFMDISNTEFLRYADGDRAAESPIIQRVTIQPIVVANSDGSNRAEFFGNTAHEADIKQKIDDIFFQAGIDIEWNNERNWNNTFANVGNGGQRNENDLFAITANGDSAGVGHNNSRVLDVYFVEVTPGFGETTENEANGLAFVDTNGITMHVGDNLVSFDAGRAVIASVVSHEIAHNLGLSHLVRPSDTNNLLYSGILPSTGDDLNASQIQTILDSQFSVPV